MNVVHVPIPLDPDTLVVLSATLRQYAGLSRDGGYMHHVRPLRFEEALVGQGIRPAGALTCDCIGGQIRGTCYWVVRAEQFEATRPVERPGWARADLTAGSAGFDAPVGAGEMVEASRG
jgi:hypothetical protein